jgi:PEP-CTERM motif
MRTKLKLALCSGVALVAATIGSPADATLVLNATGVADGFGVTDFATGLPTNFGGAFAQGPFGVTVVPNGGGGNNVLLEDYANGTLYVFNDSNGQTPGSALTTRAFQAYAEGFATLNGVAYGGNGSSYGSFSGTGVFTPLSIPGLPGPDLGMWADTKTGELIAASNGGGLIAINPTTNSFRTINGSVSADGVSVSPDGQTVYAEVGGNILGFDVTTGAKVFTAPTPGGAYSPDGTGVITSTNSLNGDIISNDNYGNLYLIDPTANTISLIGTDSNQRGDFTSPDPTNGTLLMDYSSEVERLSCGVGCGIGSAPQPSSVPEPASLALFGFGLVGLIVMRRRLIKA